jgi:two-component system, OmpR family, sensor histidine kinase SenX3
LWSQPGTGSTFTLSIPAYLGNYEVSDQPPEREIRPKRAQREEKLRR